MPKISVYEQLNAVQLASRSLKISPRHWNPGLLDYAGRLFACYRYHLGPEHASRSATAIVELNPRTLQPKGKGGGQHLNLPSPTGDSHFEDARLFMFRGQPHISFTEMRGYRPGVDYACVIKYARLKLKGDTWKIEQVFQPKYGRNTGFSKEKNWSFFEHQNELFCIYADEPTRIVLHLDGEKVVERFESPAPVWPWGNVRGGSPPIPDGEGQMLAIFHSSLATEDPPHYVRYYGGAYTFEEKPPFAVKMISDRPMMAGSEYDGHGLDPRYAEGWKPFVVFPCGCVPMGNKLLVSFGVNDWQCALARIDRESLTMTPADGTNGRAFYYRTANGSLPIRMIGRDGAVNWIGWELVGGPKVGCMAPAGYLATRNAREAEIIADLPHAVEITAEEYQRATRRIA